MNLRGWDEKYRLRGPDSRDLDSGANPLLVETAGTLKPGNALDLASGTGRNALWLAIHNWSVTAVDGAPSAIETLREVARERNLLIDARIADLKSSDYSIEPNAFDLVVICFYLQRELFEAAKAGVKPGGTLLAIVHITEGVEKPTESRLRPGELITHFKRWQILHSYEGASRDPAHRRAAAEIVAKRSPRETDASAI